MLANRVNRHIAHRFGDFRFSCRLNVQKGGRGSARVAEANELRRTAVLEVLEDLFG